MGLTNVMSRSLLSAQMSMKTAKLQHGVKKQMDGRAGVLEAEIKLDSGRGGDVTKKKEELEDVEKKSADLENTQMNLLSEMNDNLKKAAEADAEEQRAEKAAEKKKAEKATEKKKAQKEEQEERLEEIRTKTDAEGVDAIDHIDGTSAASGTGTIDITSDGSVDVNVKAPDSVGVKVDIKV